MEMLTYKMVSKRKLAVSSAKDIDPVVYERGGRSSVVEETRAVVARPEVLVSDFSMVTPPDFKIPAMISPEEKNFYYWLTLNHAPGVGAVVECGTWLGASTACLSAGLGGRPIHCFDGFVWAANYNTKSEVKLADGDDFSGLFKENMAALGVNVIVQKAMISDFVWDGSPIELLVLDMGKRAPELVHILKVFAPSLIPGQTRIVLQDYQYFPGAPITLVMDAIRASAALEFVVAAKGRNQPNSVSFLVTAPLDIAALDEVANHKTWSVERILQAWDRIMAPLPDQTRQRLAPGLAFLLYDADHKEEAIQTLSQMEMDQMMHRRWARLAETSFGTRYAPLFSLVVPNGTKLPKARDAVAMPRAVTPLAPRVPAPSDPGSQEPVEQDVASEETRAVVARPEVLVSDFSMVTPPDFKIPAMISPEEKNFYYWLTLNHAPGVGAVVECGTWLGASTACLSAGLGGRPIHCFDGFVWAANYNTKSEVKLADGDDFSGLFKENMAALGVNVIVQKAMISDFVWDGSPIELLVLDMGKRAPELVHILKVFAPSLIPGQTRIVLQDYQYFPGAPITLVMDAIRASAALEFVVAAKGRNQPNSVSFLVTAPLDIAALDEVANHKTWSVERILQAWDRIMAPLPDQTRQRLAPGLAFLLYDADHKEEAIQTLSQMEMDQMMHRRWARLAETSFGTRYAPLFSLVVPNGTKLPKARDAVAMPRAVTPLAPRVPAPSDPGSQEPVEQDVALKALVKPVKPRVAASTGAPVDETTLYRVKSVTDALLGVAELRALHDAAQAAPHGVYVEIGPAQGGSTLAIALGRKSAGRTDRFYTADVFTHSNALKCHDVDANVDVLKSNLAAFGVQGNVEVIVVPRQDPARVIPATAKIGFLFIDADGALDRDFAAFYDRVVPGGTIVLDDCKNIKSDKYVAFDEERLRKYIQGKRAKNIAQLAPFEKEYSVYRFSETLKRLGLIEMTHAINKTVFLRKTGQLTYTDSGAPEAMAKTRASIAKAFATRRTKVLRSGIAPTPDPVPLDRIARGRPSSYPSVFAAREPINTALVLKVVRHHVFDQLARFRPQVRFAQAGVGPDPNHNPFLARVLNDGWRGLFIDSDAGALDRMRARTAQTVGSKFFVSESDGLVDILRQDLIVRPHVICLDAVGSSELAAHPAELIEHKPDLIAFKHGHLSTPASLDLRETLAMRGYVFIADKGDALALSAARFDGHFIKYFQDVVAATRAS